MFFVYAIVFLIGAVFIDKIGLSYGDLFQSIFGVIFAAFGAGNAMQFAPDVASAREAAKSIFKVLDSKPKIDANDPQSTVTDTVKGVIEFKKVWFRYPTRPKTVLRGVSFKIDTLSERTFNGHAKVCMHAY